MIKCLHVSWGSCRSEEELEEEAEEQVVTCDVPQLMQDCRIALPAPLLRDSGGMGGKVLLERGLEGQAHAQS